MQLVKSRKEVIKNVYRLYAYLYSDKDEEVGFARSLLAHGWVYSASRIGGTILFAPSRFVGYIDNNAKEHVEDANKDGGRANSALAKIFSEERENKNLLIELKEFLLIHKIERNFETDKIIRFYYDDINIEFGNSCYFISPTHIGGKKPYAWNNLLQKGIAAVGWGHEDYTGWEWQEIEDDIKEQEYPNENAALEAHGFLQEMKPGDIICATNNLHNLFGIGIVASTYKYKLKIYDNGDEDGDEDWYSHYVDVAWILPKKIYPKEMKLSDGESLWKPYGTLSKKAPIPSYISRLIFHPTEIYLFPIDTQKLEMRIALNTILYGPPGTGKTYSTINKTLSIIDGPENANLSKRAEELARFNELLEDELVQFVSFHQNMSYEDFIEGIKPQSKSGTIQYSVRSGIFKSICYKALKSMYHANQPKNEALDLDVLYDEFIEHLQSTYKENDYRFKSKENSELRLDKKELDKGKIVVYFRYSNSVKKEGEGKTPFPIKKEKIKKMYEINVTGDEQNLSAKLKPVLTYHLYPYFAVYKAFLEFVKDKVGDKSEAYLKEESTSDDSDFERYLEQLQLLKKQGTELKKGQPHVLIIDEINRGNVSQIFGELITLIEEDKRFGREEALEVTLPYSQEKFVVPDNLYIIGTMNTADRSVEALDTALRRRFSFEEKMPELHELSDDVDGVNLQLLVGKINERLETLLDRDHTIGHAWLMDCKDIGRLKEVFRNKIIPLLKEFFYNDYGKIGLILGDAFFEDGRNTKENVFASFKRIDSDIRKELAQKPVFHLRMPDDQDLVNAFQSIYSSVKPNVNAEFN